MKILLTHRFFWPDTAPYGIMLRAIGERLAKDGHEVSVLSTVPSYRKQQFVASKSESPSMLNIHRVRVLEDEKTKPHRRFINIVLYCWSLFVQILLRRPDIVTASTFPPVIAAWAASLAARLVGAHFIYHIMDIHPEVAIASGSRFGKGLLPKVMLTLDNQTLRRSAQIVVLSDDMAETIRARGVENIPLRVLQNLSLDLFSEKAIPPKELRKPNGKKRVIFAGNLGRFQNLELLAEGVSRLFDTHQDLELFFLGDGAALPELTSKWKDHPQVRFAPFLPFPQASVLIAESDVGLVSLLPDMYRVAYPSKIMTYVDLGIPILALVERKSKLAINLINNGWGKVPNSVAPSDIAAALEELLDTSTKYSPLNVCDNEIIMSSWSNLINEVGQEKYG